LALRDLRPEHLRFEGIEGITHSSKITEEDVEKFLNVWCPGVPLDKAEFEKGGTTYVVFRLRFTYAVILLILTQPY
jgi:hypothetical protein